MQSVDVQDDWFADHSVLLAFLSLPSAPLARPVLRIPRPRQVSAKVAGHIAGPTPAQLAAIRQCTTTSARFGAIWATQEALISQALQRAGEPLLLRQRLAAPVLLTSLSEPVTLLRLASRALVKWSRSTLVRTADFLIGFANCVGFRPSARLSKRAPPRTRRPCTGHALGTAFLRRRALLLPSLIGGPPDPISSLVRLVLSLVVCLPLRCWISSFSVSRSTSAPLRKLC